MLRARLRLAYITLARHWVAIVSSQAREHRAWLFHEMIEAQRSADRSERREDYDRAAVLYRAFMRSHLIDPEREIARLEEELAGAMTELRHLKSKGS